jgi:beta-glucosidase
MPWLKRVSAVLEAWYPGEEDGNAVADVLFGKVNPSGKLPLTFPASAGETLAAKRDQFPGDGRVVHYGENLNVGYRAFQSSGKKPLFPFGFGLSYTTFQFSDLIVAPTSDGALVRFHVKNVGKCSGTEVAQLYVTFPQIEEGNEPPNELRGFQKIMLAAGEDRVVELALNHRDLAYWSDVQHRWRIPDGSFQFSVGDSSENLPLHGSFNTRAFMTANEDSAPRR